MTYEEAIYCLTVMRNEVLDTWEFDFTTEETDALRLALEAMTTIEQITWERDVAIQQLKEIGLSLGEKTDKVREAMELQVAKKPHIWGDGYADGALVYDMYDCPNCDKSYEIYYEKHDCCPRCGQKLDWSDWRE